MDADKLFPSKYWKSSDLNPKRPHQDTIESLKVEDVSDTDSKPVLYFNKDSRGLVLNKTRLGVLKDTLGSETEDWVGAAVILKAGTTTFQGKRTPCIVLEVPPLAAPTTTPPTTEAPAEPTAESDDVNY